MDPPQPAARCCARAVHMAEGERGQRSASAGSCGGGGARRIVFLQSPVQERAGAMASTPSDGHPRPAREQEETPPQDLGTGAGAPGGEHWVGSTGPRQGCGEHHGGTGGTALFPRGSGVLWAEGQCCPPSGALRVVGFSSALAARSRPMFGQGREAQQK